MQKRYWKKIKKRYPFLNPREHWYCGYELTQKERSGTPPILALDSGDIPVGWVWMPERCLYRTGKRKIRTADYIFLNNAGLV